MKDKKERAPIEKPIEIPVENAVETVMPPKKEVVPFVEHKLRSTIPKLRIRTAPDSTAEAIDSISIGQSATIVEEKNGWGKLKFIDGWINLKYTESA